MADLGILALGSVTNLSSTAVVGTPPVLEVIGSANDASYVHDNNNATHTGSADAPLGDTPSDFGTMTALSIQLRYLQSGLSNNTWDSLRARVFASDGTTPLTNEATVASSITTTSAVNSSVINFTGITAGNKTTWDGAIVRLFWGVTRNKGGDSHSLRVTAGQVTGTYNVAAAALAGSGALAFSNSAALAGNGDLAGTAAQAFANSGVMVAGGDLAGAGAVAFSNTGTASAVGALAGTAALAFTNTGTVSEAPDLVQLRPDATVAANGWLTHVGGTDLHTVLDETVADDDDYIQSPAHADNVEFVVGLQNPAAGTVLQPVRVRYRYRKDNDEFTVNLRMRLLENTTEIAAWDHNDISTTIAQATQTLTTEQFEAVTNWNDVRLSGIANPA